MLQLGLHRGKRRKKMQKLSKVLAVSLLNVLKVYQNGLIVWKLKLVCVIVGALCQHNFPHARGVFSGKNLNWDWPCVNRNKKDFFSLYRGNNYLSHKSIMQMHFFRKHSFQGVPNRVGKLRKFHGVGGEGGMTSTLKNGNSRGMGGLKQKCPPRGVWIFFGTTH